MDPWERGRKALESLKRLGLGDEDIPTMIGRPSGVPRAADPPIEGAFVVVTIALKARQLAAAPVRDVATGDPQLAKVETRRALAATHTSCDVVVASVA